MAGIGIGVMGTVMVGVADIAVATTVGAAVIVVGVPCAVAIGAGATAYAAGTIRVVGVTTKAS
jgi:hypothetical protein